MNIIGEAVLKDGRRLTLRTPDPDDAPQMLAYLNAVGGESDNLLFGANGFAHMSVSQEREYIVSVNQDENSRMVLGLINGRLVAVGQVRSERRERIAHNCELSITVRKDCWGIGAGSAVMSALVGFARLHGGIKNIHLGVRAGNVNAIRLYEKFGFRRVGVQKDFFNIRGVYHDEILMELNL